MLGEGKNHLDTRQQLLDVSRTIVGTILCPILIMTAEHIVVVLVDIEYHDAAEVVGFFQKFEVFLKHLASHVIVATYKLKASLSHCLFIQGWYHSRHVEYIRQYVGICKACILLASLQQECKLAQLLGTGVEVDTRKVVVKDILHSLSTTISFGNIKVIEQVETFVENMTGTAGEVCYLQIC